jgi:Short C-terminal domain/Phospholipase_D-nuclease N-terminal
MLDSLWDVIVWTFWFMLLVAWIWLLISIFSDLFRDHELGGGAKALWTFLLLILPWLGVLIYLIVRGNSMNQRAMQAARERQESFRTYVQETASTTSPADELRKLAELRDSGVITADDYERAKLKVLA